MTLHVKCRNGLYATTKDKQRAPVPDDKVKWSVSWPGYKPLNFTGELVAYKHTIKYFAIFKSLVFARTSEMLRILTEHIEKVCSLNS